MLNWSPIDPTLAFAVLCTLSWALFTVQTGQPILPTMRAALLLWLTFISGAAIALLSGFGDQKTLSLFTVTLLCVALPSIIGTSLMAQRLWLYGQVSVGLALGLGTVLFPNRSALELLGRLDIEGGTTIATSRALGAVAVLLLAVSLLQYTHNLVRVACAVFSILALLLMVLIGSRGPFISVAVAVLIVILTARMPTQRRIAGILISAVVVLVVYVYVGASNTGGSLRILAFFTGDGSDAARARLYSIAITSIMDSPQGLGWSGYAQLPGVMRFTYPHNIILEILVEGGLLAGIAFCAYALVALLRLRRLETHYGLVFYSLALYWLLASQFSSDVNGNRITWASLAFGFSLFAANGQAKTSIEVKGKLD